MYTRSSALSAVNQVAWKMLMNAWQKRQNHVKNKKNMFIVEQLKSNNNNGQRTTDTLILNELNMYDMVSNEHACIQFDECRKKE